MSGNILVLGDYRQTITVVRSLARAGYRVTLGCADRRGGTRLSRYVSEVWTYDWATPERFYDSLEGYLRRAQPDFVFTVGESQLRRLIPVAKHFEPLSTWVNPEFSTVARCFDKGALYELAPRVGVPTVPWRGFQDAESWRRAAHDMGFPVVIKRRDSAAQLRERKALIFKTAGQLDGFLATLSGESDASELVLQKYFAGVRHNCHVACADGELIGYFQQKVLSTDELDDTGIGTAGVSVAPWPELRAYCQWLTLALGYTGIGCIQFLVDESSRACAFLEFNARMDSTAALPYHLGYDYPLLAVELARYRRLQGLRPAGFEHPYAVGRTYHWLRGDFGAWLDALRHRRLGTTALAAWALDMGWMALRSHHLTFDWRDPLPTAAMYWEQFGKRALERVRRDARATSRRLRPGK